MLFNRTGDLQFGQIVAKQPDQNQIRVLPQFFRADYDMVYRMGGPYLRHLLEQIPLSGHYRYISIDSRAHLLWPTVYPCIPGWHCDDFNRDANSVPDLEHIEEKAPMRHHAVVFGATAFTEFAIEPLELPAPREITEKKSIYAIYNRMVEERNPTVRAVQSGEIVSFGPLVLHRGVPATKPSWRYFLRLTESNHWQPVNEVRTQAQVYVTAEFEQW